MGAGVSDVVPSESKVEVRGFAQRRKRIGWACRKAPAPQRALVGLLRHRAYFSTPAPERSGLPCSRSSRCEATLEDSP